MVLCTTVSLRVTYRTELEGFPRSKPKHSILAISKRVVSEDINSLTANALA
jgi:hypothetical protein